MAIKQFAKGFKFIDFGKHLLFITKKHNSDTKVHWPNPLRALVDAFEYLVFSFVFGTCVYFVSWLTSFVLSFVA